MKTYSVEIRGIVHTMQLSDEDADRLGVKPVEQVEQKQRAPRNKAASGQNK